MMHRLDVLGDWELRETLLFARAQELPVTADEVAAAHRVGPTQSGTTSRNELDRRERALDRRRSRPRTGARGARPRAAHRQPARSTVRSGAWGIRWRSAREPPDRSWPAVPPPARFFPFAVRR